MRIGQIVAQRFRIEARHAEGGMGELFRAADTVTGDVVAVKVLRSASALERERFDREAQALAELRHPAIVRYVTHGATPDGEPFLAMEWLEGEDLDHRLSRGPCMLGEALTLARRVAEGLHQAHRRGVVHRDLKPSNLFLVGGRIEDLKILDFGIARTGGARVTRTGVLVGTPGYMAPEQASSVGSVTPAIDVFALGCVLFEALAGRPAFAGNNVMAILAKLVFEPAPRLAEHFPGAPRALDDLVARMLAKDPSERPRDAGALLEELRALDLGDAAEGTLEAAPPAPPGALTEGERRVVSVLVIGHGGAGVASAPTVVLGETLSDASPAGAVFGQLKATLEGADARFAYLPNGTIVATIGGLGVAKDRAGLAARFALSLRPLVPDRHIVLATGRGGGTGGGPLGDTIERAIERLERCPAEPPTRPPPIALDDATAALLDARFALRDTDAGAELWGERSTADNLRTLLGKPAPCFGRERDLRTLEETWRECVEEGVAQAVIVTAAPGVGKSRLANEFVAGVRARGGEIWSGQTDYFRMNSPLALLGRALADALGVVGSEALADRRRAIAARVSACVPAEDATRVAELLGEIVGAPFPDDDSPVLRAARQDAQLMAEHMAHAFEDFVRARCAAGPVLMVLDELQWSDTPSVRFVDAALRRLSEAPFFVLALGRPEASERFPNLWAERRLQQIRLGPLSRKASERLVRHMLGDAVTAATCERIVELADGNAFYLEELIRTAAEGGEALPETVVAMVQSRIEALEPEARRVLRAASIFGDVFWPEGVRALLGAGATTQPTRDWIALLVERELVTPRKSSRFAGAELSFRHALLREGAYSMLTDDDRVLGHRLAAEWLEAQGERDARVLAEHCERSAQPARAARYYATAAEHALEANHVEAAAACADRGLELGAEGELRGALLSVGSAARLSDERLVECVSMGLEALDLLPAGSARWYRVFHGLFPAITFTQPARLAEITPRFLATPYAPDAAPDFIHAATWVSVMFSITGNVDLCTAMLEKMRGAAAGLDRSDVATRAYFGGAIGNFHHLVRESVWECMETNRAALRGFAEIGLRTYQCIMGTYHGKALFDLGRLDESERALRETLAVAEAYGAPLPLAYVRCYLARLLVSDTARDRIDEACALAEEVTAAKNESLQGIALAVLAEARRRRGDLAGADERSRDACARLQPYPAYAWAPLAERVRLLLQLGRVDDALALAEETVARFVEMRQAGYGEVDLWAALALARHTAGRLEEARAATLTAMAKLRARVDALPEHARAGYLGAVATHADLIARATEWLGPDAVRDAGLVTA